MSFRKSSNPLWRTIRAKVKRRIVGGTDDNSGCENVSIPHLSGLVNTTGSSLSRPSNESINGSQPRITSRKVWGKLQEKVKRGNVEGMNDKKCKNVLNSSLTDSINATEPGSDSLLQAIDVTDGGPLIITPTRKPFALFWRKMIKRKNIKDTEDILGRRNVKSPTLTESTEHKVDSRSQATDITSGAVQSPDLSSPSTSTARGAPSDKTMRQRSLPRSDCVLNTVTQCLALTEAIAGACPVVGAPLKSACNATVLILRSIDQKRQNKANITGADARLRQLINTIGNIAVEFDELHREKILTLARALEDKVEDLEEFQRIGSANQLVNAKLVSNKITNWINGAGIIRDDYMMCSFLHL